MKQLFYMLLLLSIATACATGRPSSVDKPSAPNLVSTPGEDDEEYELIIIDPGFQSWFASYSRPINYYSPQYYEQWNQRYVSAWNELVLQQNRYRNLDYPFQERINYDTTVDYGVDLNYQLYWYFRYIESQYGRQYNFPGSSVRSGRL